MAGEQAPTGAALAQQVAQGMAALSEGLDPVFEAAKGVKAKLEADGWSPTAAEAAALTWLQGALTKIWSM